MQYKASKKVLAILLLVCMLMSSFSNIAFAFDGGPGSNLGGSDGGSSGATYNEGTGSADIVTGTASGGADKDASRNQWAITEKNGTFTRT
jgi:hypothetical protein